MLNVIITGGSGFIGQRLVHEHLRRGDQVSIITRNEYTDLPEGALKIVGDLAKHTEPIGFPERADVLYHCAAEISDPAQMVAINHLGTRRLAEFAAGRIGRWVQLSSVGVYGPQNVGCITEDSPIRPVNEYEISKALGDAAVLKVAAVGGFSCAVLRPSIVFGDGMPNRSLLQLA